MFGWIKRRKEIRQRIAELKKKIDGLQVSIKKEENNQRLIDLYAKFDAGEKIEEDEYQELLDWFNRKSNLLIESGRALNEQSSLINEESKLIIENSNKKANIAILIGVLSLPITVVLAFIL